MLIKSNRGFFNNQGDVTLGIMIQSGQFLKTSEISSMSNLFASFRKTQSKLNKLTDNKIKQRLFQKSRGCNSKINEVLKILRNQPSQPYITKTCLYNSDSLKPHFYIVKLGFTGVNIIFLISVKKT